MTRTETILVVDDVRANRMVAAAFLEADGYAVRQAASGEQALADFAQYQADLVILDLMMPGMDGFATASALRKLHGGRDVPILILTALAEFGTHERAITSGADDFLTKPIQRSELSLRVRSLLRITRLHRELVAANSVLIAQRDSLIEATMSRHRIAAMIVHDVKTPLASILGNARYIEDTQALPDDVRAAAHDVTATTQRVHRMMLDLLDVSRAEEAKLVPQMSTFAVRPLLLECTLSLQHLAMERSCAIGVEAPEDLMLVADRDLTRRMIENLADNALGHTSVGTEVALSAAREEGKVTLRVKDRGPGVEPASRDQVFLPFVQLESGTKRRGSRGLGLAFCKLVMNAHAGEIWVEDNVPDGSVFCARFSASLD
jgi:two-component system, sensor histidine kinase and response regulator